MDVLRYILIALLLSIGASACSKEPYDRRYIEKYKPAAYVIQCEHGIPACIVLAQACLESGFGRSIAARHFHNHFGIKLNDECKQYDTVDECFSDYARILTSFKRYEPLFELCVKDYRGWAQGLQDCGYCSDKYYATKLICIIEKYKLYE